MIKKKKRCCPMCKSTLMLKIDENKFNCLICSYTFEE